MRTILFVALFVAAVGAQANGALAQVRGVQSKPAPAANAAAEIAARPDAFRYYWHNGEWWYFTAQNSWLRWNGKTWVQHHSINDAGAFAPAQAAAQSPVQQPSAGNAAVAPSTDNGPTGESYRYQINRRKGGL